jgi:hypothetical protein
VRNGENENLARSRRDAPGPARHPDASGDLYVALIDPQDLVRGAVNRPNSVRAGCYLEQTHARYVRNVSHCARSGIDPCDATAHYPNPTRPRDDAVDERYALEARLHAT